MERDREVTIVVVPSHHAFTYLLHSRNRSKLELLTCTLDSERFETGAASAGGKVVE